jgi:hypothetical protein
MLDDSGGRRRFLHTLAAAGEGVAAWLNPLLCGALPESAM